MSTSDSDYSIDWLASDEDDCVSPDRLSPQQADAPPAPSSSSSSSSSSSLSPSSKSTPSLRESPSSCFLSASTQRRRRRSDCKDGGCCSPPAAAHAHAAVTMETPAVSPVQGFTSVCSQQQQRQQTLCHAVRKRPRSDALNELCEKPQADTENQLFSLKCTELQCYVRPLSSILHGLRSGRYSERLSSFQESVAMDRIQRIMGVLQNPNMGGRFLSIILKIEEMLQSWFPHIKPNLTPRDDSTPAKKQKQHHCIASPPPSSPASFCSSDSSSSTSTHLKWFHTSPICSLKTPESTLHRPAAAAAATTTSATIPASTSSPLPTRCNQEVTQDNSVSSSTDSLTRRLGNNSSSSSSSRPSRGPALPFKISSPCLERLLQAKESIIAPRTVGDGGWLS